MTLLFGHDKTVGEWVGNKVRKPFLSPFTSIGVLDREGTLIGGFVFNDFTGTSIEMSVAGKGIFSRGAWRGVINYVFEQLKCSRLQIHTSRKNKTIKNIAPKVGFVFEGKSRNFYGENQSALVYSLTTNDLPAFKKRWGLN